jgi:uncharacterized membrane protein YccC
MRIMERERTGEKYRDSHGNKPASPANARRSWRWEQSQVYRQGEWQNRAMRLTAPRKWQRTDLHRKLRAKPLFRIVNWEHQRLLAHAFKTTLAAALCWWIAKLLGLHDGYWGSISAIIVLQSYVGATVTASRDRLIGTFIGAGFGFLFSLWSALPWSFLCALMAALSLCGLLGLKNSARLAGVTVCIVMLVQTAGSHWPIALGRISEVVLGIVIALAVSTLVLPDRARLRLKDCLAQEYLQLGALFEATLKGFRGEPAGNLTLLREETLKTLEANDELLETARNEPSGGAGWREGLNTLAQFGWSLFDALGALELAVRDSSDDAYAHQLEPVLGLLATDIRNGFNFVAHCIDKWRFHTAPQDINLEEDITKLEARVAEVRHTGLNFSQDEILRAYAVQLHLKQIARMLHASRVQTSAAIGEAHLKHSAT